MFAISVVTLLSPKPKLASPAVSWKKFGEYPKSISHPAIPAPIQPSDAPISTRFSTESSKLRSLPKFAVPPKFPPTNGVKYQSAEARLGAAAVAHAANATANNNLRIDIDFLRVE